MKINVAIYLELSTILTGSEKCLCFDLSRQCQFLQLRSKSGIRKWEKGWRNAGKVPSFKLRNRSVIRAAQSTFLVWEPNCNSRSAEPGGGHIEGDPHPQVKRELGETKMELQMQRGVVELS